MTSITKPTRVTGVILLTLVLGGCDFITPVTTNPNAVPTASVEQLFTAIQVNSYFLAEGQISRIAAIWTQQMAGTDRQFVSIDSYVITEEDANGEFSTVYTGGGLIDIRTAIALANDNGRRTFEGILKVHEAYMIGMTASIFGDIPYSEAANADIAEPVLDGQAAVYAAIQSLLDEAIADLGSGQAGVGGPGLADLSLGGDVAAWTAVAYTLKARFHMHWGETTASAYVDALAAAQNGIQDAAGTWKTIHSNAATENNLWFQFQRDRSGYISSGDHLLALMDGDSDPRLYLWYSCQDPDKQFPPDCDQTTIPGPAKARVSELSPTGYGSSSFNLPMVSCAENAFIIAEAQFAASNFAAAITAAEDGLTCQEDEWSVDLAAQATAIGLLTGAPLLAAIMDQKYIALFLNAEVYNDYKRTCLPAITENTGGMPGRLFYGQDERQSNTNVPEPGAQPARNANDTNAC